MLRRERERVSEKERERMREREKERVRKRERESGEKAYLTCLLKSQLVLRLASLIKQSKSSTSDGIYQKRKTSGNEDNSGNYTATVKFETRITFLGLTRGQTSTSSSCSYHGSR